MAGVSYAGDAYYPPAPDHISVLGPMLVGWLVVFWALRSFETVFQSISGRLPD